MAGRSNPEEIREDMNFRTVRSFLSLVLFVLLMAGAAGVHAKLAFQVKDINTTAPRPVGLDNSLYSITLGSAVFFPFDDGSTGKELWKVEGATGTPSLVKDICPGPCPSEPILFTSGNGLVYFAASDGVHGWEVWRSDGTADGTVMVRDFTPGPRGSVNFLLAATDGTVFFDCIDSSHGRELCATDGTAAGTRLVADINPGPNGSLPTLLATAGGRLLLVADDGVHGREPWISDGSEAGTRPVGDLNPGSAPSLDSPYYNPIFDSSVAPTIALGLPDGSFVFGANDGVHGYEAWHTDGTAVGTALVTDIRPGSDGSSPSRFTAFAGKAFFAAADGLWSTDGTTAGTALVKAVSAAALSVVNGRLYFNGNGSLWTSDGTADGTVEVSSAVSPNSIDGSGGSLLILRGDPWANPTTSLSLWKSDGTGAGTVLLEPFGQQENNCRFGRLGFVAGTLYFYACPFGTVRSAATRWRCSW
jgi:ELWxxDGT repeat protein